MAVLCKSVCLCVCV